MAENSAGRPRRDRRYQVMRKDKRVYALYDTHREGQRTMPMVKLRCGWPTAKHIENALNYAYENELPDFRDLPIAHYNRGKKGNLWNT